MIRALTREIIHEEKPERKIALMCLFRTIRLVGFVHNFRYFDLYEKPPK